MSTSNLTIRSRPEELEEAVLGSGSISLRLDVEQVELLAALVSNCRLGQAQYSNAAFEILEMLEDEFGSDFVHDAADLVNLQVTIEDDAGSVVFSTKSGKFYPTLEV